MARHSSGDEEFVIVNNGRVSRPASWSDAMYFWLSPVGGIDVKYDDVVEVSSVLVLTTKDEEFVVLPETGSVALED